MAKWSRFARLFVAAAGAATLIMDGTCRAQSVPDLVKAYEQAGSAGAKEKAAVAIFKRYDEYKHYVAGNLADEAFKQTRTSIDEQLVKMSQDTWAEVAAKTNVSHVVPIGTLGDRQTNPKYIPGKSDKDFIPMGPGARQAPGEFNQAFLKKYGIEPQKVDINVLDPTDIKSWPERVRTVAESEKYNTVGGNRFLQDTMWEKNQNVWGVDPKSGSISESKYRDIVGDKPPKPTSTDTAGYFSDNSRFRDQMKGLPDDERILKTAKYDIRNADAYNVAGGKLTKTEADLLEAAAVAREGNVKGAIEAYGKATGLSGEEAARAYLKGMDDLNEKIGRTVVGKLMDEAVQSGKPGMLKQELAGVIANLPPETASKLQKEFAGDVARADIWNESQQVAKSLQKAGAIERFGADYFNKQALSQYGKYYDQLSDAEKAALHGAAEESASFGSKALKAAGYSAAAGAAAWALYDAYATESAKGGTGRGIAAFAGRAAIEAMQYGLPPLAAAELVGRLAAMGVNLGASAYKNDVLDTLYERYRNGEKLEDLLGTTGVAGYYAGGLRELAKQLREEAEKNNHPLTDEQLDAEIRSYFERRLTAEKQCKEIQQLADSAEAWIHKNEIPLSPGGSFATARSDNEQLLKDNPAEYYRQLGILLGEYKDLEASLRSAGAYFNKANVWRLLWLKRRATQEDFDKEMARLLGKPYPPKPKKKKLPVDDKPTTPAQPVTTGTKIKSAKNATIDRKNLPGGDNVIKTRKVLVSTGGSFKDKKVGEPCDSAPSFGPFEVAGGGRLSAQVLGSPPVPNEWSMGNWNTSMAVYWEPQYGQGHGGGSKIIELAGQAKDSNLSATAEWPAAGKISVGMGAPGGSGVFNGRCFGQGYTAKVEITAMFTENPARSGDVVKPGDRVKTKGGGSVTGTTADGSRYKIGERTDATFNEDSSGKPVIEVNNMGPGGSTRVQHNGKGSSPAMKVDGALVTPSGTEYLCYRNGETTHVAVVEGSVIITTGGQTIKLEAGQDMELCSGKIAPYDLQKDDHGELGGIPLKDLVLDNETSQPYGELKPEFSGGRIGGSWIWEDPGQDVTVETPDTSTLRLIVPNGNSFWDRDCTAPRLLHKVTGDFALETKLDMKCQGQDLATCHFILKSPGSYLGFLDNQCTDESPIADYLTIPTRQKLQGHDKMPALNKTFPNTPDSPDGPVWLRLTRHADTWKMYWSADGRHWNLAMRRDLLAPDTLYAGWLFQRAANDGLTTEPATNTLTETHLVTAPRGELPEDEWDTDQAAGVVSVRDGRAVMALDGHQIGGITAQTSRKFAGDFDLSAHYSAGNWSMEPGQSKRLNVFATDGTDRNYAYAGMVRSDQEPWRYSADLCFNNGWNRGYQFLPTLDDKGWLRITRRGDTLSMFAWREGEWQQIDKKFTAGFSDPVYLGFRLSNEGGTTASATWAELELADLREGTTEAAAWTPENPTVMPRVDVPADVQLPEGAGAEYFAAPFRLSSFFCAPDGNTYLFSGERDKAKLLMMDTHGMVTTCVTTDVLTGENRKTGAWHDGKIMMALDYWPGGGNKYGGLIDVGLDGSFEQAKCKTDLGGLSDITSDGKGGWYLADFERDQIFNLLSGAEEAVPLIRGDAIAGINSLAFDPSSKALYFVNYEGPAPFGGKPAIYRLGSDGKPQLLAAHQAGGNFYAVTVADRGPFKGVLVTDYTSGTVARLGRDGALTKILSGLTKPSYVRVNPASGDLMVLCDDQFLLKVHSENDAKPETASPPVATPEPVATQTPRPTITPRPIATKTFAPAQTPKPSPTPPAEATPEPSMTPTPKPVATPTRAANNFRPIEWHGTAKTDWEVLTSRYPRRNLRMDLKINLKQPGTLLDTVGINAAAAGAFGLRVAEGGAIVFQVFAPKATSPVRDPNGWHVLTSKTKVAADADYAVSVDVADRQITLSVDGNQEASVELATPLSGEPVYIGDFPGDEHWGKKYNIHQAAIGDVTVLYFGNREGAPQEEAGKPQVTATQEEPAQTPAEPRQISASSGRAYTEKEAMDLLMKVPRVREWGNQVNAASRQGARRYVRIEKEEGDEKSFRFRLYESVPDGGTEGHTATFGRFEVEKQGGRISEIDPVTGELKEISADAEQTPSSDSLSTAAPQSSEGSSAQPAASALVFSREGQVWYMELPAGQARKIGKGDWPALSPDGKFIAYCQTGEPGDASLVLADLASGSIKTLLPRGRNLQYPMWSPNGDRILVLDRTDKEHFRTVSPAGKEIAGSPEIPGDSAFMPVWCANGTLLFHDMNFVYELDEKGAMVSKTPTKLFPGKEAAITSEERFAPKPGDPELYVYSQAVSGTPYMQKTFGEPNTAIFLFDKKTNKRSAVSPETMLAFHPVWSPDGKFIYFEGYPEKDFSKKDPFRIYRINPDGTGLQEVTRGTNPNVR